MKSAKSRIEKLEQIKSGLTVHLSSIAFEPGHGSQDSNPHQATFNCEAFEIVIARGKYEDASEFRIRAGREGLAMAQCAHPGAIVLAPDVDWL